MAITNSPTPPFLSQKTCMEPTFMNEQSKRNHGNQRFLTTKQLRAALLGLTFQSYQLPIGNYQFPHPPFSSHFFSFLVKVKSGFR